LQRLILRPKQDLPSAAELLELLEQEPDDPADALVWVHLDLPDLVPAIARREDELQLAPQRLRIPRRYSALAQQAQLVLGHRPLQPQEKAIIDQARIVRAVRIDHQRPDESAHIDQLVPVRPFRARQDASMQNTAPAEPEQTEATNFWKPGRSTKPDPERPRWSSNHCNRGKSARARRIGQRVLPPLALGMLGDLPHGRLADIDYGAAAEVLRRDLGMHHTPPARPVSLCIVCRGLRGAGRPAPVAGHPVLLLSGASFRRDRDRGPVDCGSDVSSEPSIAVEKFNDPPRGRPAERVSRTTRNSVSASIAILALPTEIAPQTAASHIHAEISRESPAGFGIIYGWLTWGMLKKAANCPWKLARRCRDLEKAARSAGNYRAAQNLGHPVGRE